MIIDAHTDVLWKMLKNPEIKFNNSESLSVNYENMVKGNVGVQIFAIFVSTLKHSKFLNALQSVDDFYEKVLNKTELVLAKSYSEILSPLKENKKVGLLSLEGAEAIEGDLSKLRIFYQLGVRAIGLTWNDANEVADGVMETRGAGLTNFGRELVREINRLGMMIDVSHLSEKGFWDVIELSQQAVMASHSNAKAICSHPRNLTDQQIKAIITKGGMIGITFVQNFTSKNENPSMDELLLHIDHIAALGGANSIGLGSDFDGAKTLVGLEDASKYDQLMNLLEKKYPSDFVKGMLNGNWLKYFEKILKD